MHRLKPLWGPHRNPRTPHKPIHLTQFIARYEKALPNHYYAEASKHFRRKKAKCTPGLDVPHEPRPSHLRLRLHCTNNLPLTPASSQKASASLITQFRLLPTRRGQRAQGR